MAIGSQFWGNASGKLGQQVLYRAGGEQRARMHVAKIKNPKTLAQMENRLSMRNFAQVFRSLKPILEKSFPNRPIKESGFNAFVKANKGIGSPVVTKEGALQGLCVPYNMVISQGYLTQFGECKKQPISADAYRCGFDLSNHPNFNAIKALAPDYDSIDEFPQSQENYQALWDALQIPSNGKITIVVAEYADEGYLVKSVSLSRDSDYRLATNSPFELSLRTWRVGEDDHIILSAGDNSTTDIVGIIISWVDGAGKLQVTNTRMMIPDEDESFGTQFCKGGDVYVQVLDQYGYTENSAL